MQDSKKGAARIERQREQLDRAVVAAIASTRNDLDLNQDELAERMGWSREIVSNIEQGRRQVSVADLVLIARALEVDPETIFRRVLHW